MMAQYVNGHVVIKRNFKDFKNAFNKKEWRRNLRFKKSFFDLHYMSHENYIHASIIIIDRVRYRFTFLSYIKFLIFIYLNRTTSENINRNVNNKKDIRKQKLKKLNYEKH
jgi:hypothetical protein